MVVEIDIDYQLCTRCKKCIKACSFGVLEWFEETPIVTNPHNCSTCLECEVNCPVTAIRIKEK